MIMGLVLSLVMFLTHLKRSFPTGLATSATALSISTKIQPVTLITFDVDGTLIHGSSSQAEVSAHARAFSHAAGKVFLGQDDFEMTVASPVLVIPSERYHGSTDGLISINFAKYKFDIDPKVALEKLPIIYEHMSNYFSAFSDDEVMKGIEPLPGVLDCLKNIKNTQSHLENNLLCGLVTGNVEGIARKKMRACGIFGTGVLSAKAETQLWPSELESAFLGGFGSDFCSGEISIPERYYKDRAEQIVIAFNRAQSLLQLSTSSSLSESITLDIIDNKNKPNNKKLVRVVHVGDAPTDILAAKWCAEAKLLGDGVVVGCIGVATGKYSASHLRSLSGETIPGIWEPVILEQGLADPDFIRHCNIHNCNSDIIA
eukprot:gene7208-14700_t